MKVYLLYHFSNIHSVWDSKEKAIDYVMDYAKRHKEYKYAGPQNFYISEFGMNGGEEKSMIWSSWYHGKEQLKQVMGSA